MINLRIKSTHCRNALRIYQDISYTLHGRNFSCLTIPSHLQSHATPGRTSATPNVCSLQRQQRNLSESATEVNMAFTNQIAPSSPFTGLWQTLSESKPVAYIQDALTAIHDYSGLPWWASIVVSTVLFRTLITLPLAIYQYKIMARLELLTLEMPAIVAELKKEGAIAMKQFKWTEEHTRYVYNRSLKKQWDALIVRDNCHPAKTFIVLWGQIPLWVCQSIALRNLVHMMPDPTTLQAQVIYTEMTIGGFGWIPNLTEVDSSYILPVALGLINLGIIEFQTILRTRPATRLQKYSTHAFRVLSVAMIPIACTVPSALCVYWVASSSYGLAQNLVLATPVVRRAFGIPQTQSEVTNPYERIWDKMKAITEKSEQKPATESTNVPNNETKSK